MNETKNKLTVIDGETLMDMRLVPTRFCVETLLPQGVSMLGGAPKIGKSWMVLDLCIRIAQIIIRWPYSILAYKAYIIDISSYLILYVCIRIHYICLLYTSRCV